MNRILITEACFPASQISNLITRYKADVFSLDGHIQGATLETPLAVNSINRVWTDAYRLAQNWYVLGGKDITAYEGISFGKIIEIGMWYYLRSVLEKIETIKRLLDAVSPDEIYLATFDNRTIEQIIIAMIGPGVRITNISPPFRSRLNGWRDIEFIRDRLKQWEVDRYARWLAVEFGEVIGQVSTSSRLTSRRMQSDIKVLGLLEQPGDYLADSILPVLSLFSESAVLLMDHRHTVKVCQAGVSPLYFSEYVLRHLGSFPKYWKIFADRWTSSQHLLSSSFQCNGLHLWPIVSRRLHRVFQYKFPAIGVESEAAREILVRHRVKSLLLTSDAHHGERLFTLIANQLDIPSLVIQHGATLDEWGYVPLYATRFAAWGNSSRQWLIENGVPSEKIVVTGSPRSDQFVCRNPSMSREDFCSRMSIPVSDCLILWVVDPIPEIKNTVILQRLIGVIRALPWAHLIIRPHPGSPQVSWLTDIVTGQERVLVSSAVKENLYDLLSIVDMVIIQCSTVGIEAMLFGKPVLIFEPVPITETNVLYDNTEAVVRVTTDEQLHQVVEELYQIKREQYIDHYGYYGYARNEFIKQYFCALDGKSAQRIAKALSELMGEYS